MPKPSKTRRPTTVSSSRRSRKSWRATGASFCDANESRARFPPRRPDHERVGDRAGSNDQGPRRSPRGDRSRPQRRDEARGVDRRRGAQDPGLLRGYREVETHLVMSRPGKRTIVEETEWTVADVEALATHRYDNNDIGAAI